MSEGGFVISGTLYSFHQRRRLFFNFPVVTMEIANAIAKLSGRTLSICNDSHRKPLYITTDMIL